MLDQLMDRLTIHQPQRQHRRDHLLFRTNLDVSQLGALEIVGQGGQNLGPTKRRPKPTRSEADPNQGLGHDMET